MNIPTLSVLKLLEEKGLGKIDKDLFWEKLGLGKDGLYIESVGQAARVGERKRVNFMLYSRAKNDVAGYDRAQAAAEALSDASVCSHPEVKNLAGTIIAGEIANINIRNVSTVNNAGQDSDGRTLWSISGQIIY